MSIEPNGPQLTPTEADIRHHVHQYWKAYAIQGAVQLVLGLIAVAAPFAATYVTVIFFGALLVSAGILGLVGAFSMRGRSPGSITARIGARRADAPDLALAITRRPSKS